MALAANVSLASAQTQAGSDAAATPDAVKPDQGLAVSRFSFPALVNALSTAESDYFRSKLERCWRSNEGAERPDKITVRVQLNRDGTLKADPIVMQPRVMIDEDARTQARRAVQAVKSCAPYSELDQARYAYWSMFDLRFGVDAPVTRPPEPKGQTQNPWKPRPIQ